MSTPGQSAWATDLDTAHTYAMSTAQAVATARGWDSIWTQWIVSTVNAAMHTADGWFRDDVGGFWTEVASEAAEAAALPNAPDGMSKLAAAWHQAAVTTTGAEETQRANSATGLAADTAAASVADVADVAKAGADAAKGAGRLLKRRGTWYVIGTVIAAGIGLRLVKGR